MVFVISGKIDKQNYANLDFSDIYSYVYAMKPIK